MNSLPKDLGLFQFLDSHTKKGLMDIMREYMLPEYYTIMKVKYVSSVMTSDRQLLFKLKDGGNKLAYRHPFLYVDIDIDSEDAEVGTRTQVYNVITGESRIVEEQIEQVVPQKKYQYLISEDENEAIYTVDGRVVYKEPIGDRAGAGADANYPMMENYMIIQNGTVALDLSTLEEIPIPGEIVYIPLTGSRLILKHEDMKSIYDLQSRTGVYAHPYTIAVA